MLREYPGVVFKFDLPDLFLLIEKSTGKAIKICPDSTVTFVGPSITVRSRYEA